MWEHSLASTLPWVLVALIAGSWWWTQWHARSEALPLNDDTKQYPAAMEALPTAAQTAALIRQRRSVYPKV